jgi:hypothetical protein
LAAELLGELVVCRDRGEQCVASQLVLDLVPKLAFTSFAPCCNDCLLRISHADFPLYGPLVDVVVARHHEDVTNGTAGSVDHV